MLETRNTLDLVKQVGSFADIVTKFSQMAKISWCLEDSKTLLYHRSNVADYRLHAFVWA